MNIRTDDITIYRNEWVKRADGSYVLYDEDGKLVECQQMGAEFTWGQPDGILKPDTNRVYSFPTRRGKSQWIKEWVDLQVARGKNVVHLTGLTPFTDMVQAGVMDEVFRDGIAEHLHGQPGPIRGTSHTPGFVRGAYQIGSSPEMQYDTQPVVSPVSFRAKEFLIETQVRRDLLEDCHYGDPFGFKEAFSTSLDVAKSHLMVKEMSPEWGGGPVASLTTKDLDKIVGDLK